MSLKLPGDSSCRHGSGSDQASSAFLARVRESLDNLTSPAAGGILIGLSGGPDSVALLLAAHSWSSLRQIPIAAAHLNHQLRGDQATADVQFCRDLCSQLEVPLFEHSADPRPLARSRGQGLEEAGRHLRRTFCETLLSDHPEYAWIATGHHRDDQIETVLMRLFRGTGPDGLRGIRPVQGVWLHPLLAIKRVEILAFLEAQGQPWRTDTSNLQGDNVRARLRRELLPLLRDIFGTGCTDNPARLASLLADDCDVLRELTQQWLTDCQGPDNSLLVDELSALPAARSRRVLHAWCHNQGYDLVEKVHLENILVWLRQGTSGTALDLPDGWRLRRDFAELHLQRPKKNSPPLRFASDYRIVVQPDGEPSPMPAVGVGDPLDETTWSLQCPAAVLRGNLQVRNIRPGDRMQSFGLSGTKKLSDLLRERRVAHDRRQGVLVVADEAGILWVVGLARAERTRLLPSPCTTVTIRVTKRSGPQPMKECP